MIHLTNQTLPFDCTKLQNESTYPCPSERIGLYTRIIEIYYPNIIQKPDYLEARIQIEIGCRSLKEPFTIRPISSLVDIFYPHMEFALPSIQVPSVNPERTFLEKIFLLHEEFQRPKEKMRSDRLSRHLYDVDAIDRCFSVFCF